MGRHKVITSEHEEFIKANSTRLTPLEMAEHLPISERTISNYMRANAIRKTLHKIMGGRRSVKGKEGFFNVMERANWLI